MAVGLLLGGLMLRWLVPQLRRQRLYRVAARLTLRRGLPNAMPHQNSSAVLLHDLADNNGNEDGMICSKDGDIVDYDEGVSDSSSADVLLPDSKL